MHMNRSVSLLASCFLLTTACGIVQVKGAPGTSATKTSSAPTSGAPNGASSGDDAHGPGTTSRPSGAAADKGPNVEDQRKAHLSSWQKSCGEVEAALAAAPAEDLLEDLDASYPSTDYVKLRTSLIRETDGLRHDFETKEGLSIKTPSLEELVASHAEYGVVKTRLLALDQKLAEKVQLPKDVYKKPDAAQVKAAFKTYAMSLKDPGKFVSVVITDADWDRKHGLSDDGRAYDQGFVTGYFVVERAPSAGEIWRVRARKDFMDGGKVKFDTYAPSKLSGIKLPLK
jgi:hypothetical protein